MDIKSLPCNVRVRLRSGANVNSVDRCVMELVLNSLDAKSTAIAVRVNLLTFRIQVVDNGRGITKPNMNLVGIRYMTSKCQTLADLRRIKRFGFRGEALASIGNMSKKLTITSRPDGIENTYTKIHENGKWSAMDLLKRRASQGTTVTVEGYMHNLPVRQKRINPSLDLHIIKRSMEGLAIIHPDVSFNLRNDATGKIVFQSNKTRMVSQALVSFYPDISISDLMEIKISKNKICVSGLICKTPSTNNKVQFVYLNKRPIVSPKIQNLLNSILIKSRIFQKSPHGTGDFLRFGTSTEKTEHPVYVVNIRCPYSEVDLTLSPSKKTVEFKQWNIVLTCIEKAVVKLLECENLIDPGSGTQEVVTAAAPSHQSQFGVSQIRGAVKGVPSKRKFVENRTEMVQECSGIGVNGKNETERVGKDLGMGENCEDERKGLENSPKISFNFKGDHAKILTTAEVHHRGKITKKVEPDVLPSNIGKISKKRNRKSFQLIVDDANDIDVLSPARRCYEVRNENIERGIRKGKVSKKSCTKGNCFKIVPSSAKYKSKNARGRPTLCGKTKTGAGKSIFANFNESREANLRNAKMLHHLIENKCTDMKSFGKNPKTNSVDKNTQKNGLWKHINEFIIAPESLNKNTFNEAKNNKPQTSTMCEISKNTSLLKNTNQDGFKRKHSASDGKNLDLSDDGKKISTNIFHKHQNTQSLVFNSEVNASKSNVHSLLNSTIHADTLENQEKGKNLIMEMFLKSTFVFPNERPEVNDHPIKTVVVETTKENFITEHRNHNTTMMTASWKIMSKKTTMTNSLHPMRKLRSEPEENRDTCTNDDQQAQLQNAHHQNNKKEKQSKHVQDRMVSKCIQTTMLEHQEEFKINFNSGTQPEFHTNSKFTFFSSVAQNRNSNVTFSKYFKGSHKEKDRKPKENFRFENDLEFYNGRCNLLNFDEVPNYFGIRDTSCGFTSNTNHEHNRRRYKNPVINFGNHALSSMQVPQVGTMEWLHQPVDSHHTRNCCNNFPWNSKNYENFSAANDFNAFDGRKMFSSYDLYGKNFRKPIKKYISDYNFDFSNLNDFDEQYRQFRKEKYYNNGLLFIKRANRLENLMDQQQNNSYMRSNWADLTNDITVPLYQSYIPNKPEFGHRPSYKHFIYQDPVNNKNLMNTRKWHEEVQRPARNKTQWYNSKVLDENFRSGYNKNHGQCESADAMLSIKRKKLYESIFCDYGQENRFQTAEHFKIPKLERQDFRHNFFDKKVLQPMQNKPDLEQKQTMYHRNPVSQRKYDTRKEEQTEPRCYSPFFQKPTRNYKNQHEVCSTQNPKNYGQNYQYYKVRNGGTQKNTTGHPDLPTEENFRINPCVSPFFHKTSDDVPGFTSKRLCNSNTNKIFGIASKSVPQQPIKKAVANQGHIKSSREEQLFQINGHRLENFLTPPHETTEVPLQQELKHGYSLLREEGCRHRQFFLPGQSNNLVRRHKDSFLLDHKQLEKSERKLHRHQSQVQGREEMLAKGELKKSLCKTAQKRKHSRSTQNPQSSVFFVKNEEAQSNWQLLTPLTNTSFHQKSKLSLKKFITEPLQQKPKVADFLDAVSNKNSNMSERHIVFQQTEPAMKNFFSEPFGCNFFKNYNEHFELPKFNLFQQPKPLFENLTPPKCNKEVEFNFTTPNINCCSTAGDAVEKITLNDSENLESSNPEAKEEENLTVCSENFKPALSSTRHDIVENNVNKSNSSLEVAEGTEQHKNCPEGCGFSSDVIEATPAKNFADFFIPSLTQGEISKKIKFSRRHQQHQNSSNMDFDLIEGKKIWAREELQQGDDVATTICTNFKTFLENKNIFLKENHNSKESASALDISINPRKKLKLIEKGMTDDCKLNKSWKSDESEQSNANFLNSGNCDTENVLNFPPVKNTNENGFEKVPEDEWVPKRNELGRMFYIHRRTGMTSIRSPKQDSYFNLAKRLEFVPKGLSPIFTETKKINASLSPTSKKSLHATILENYENELNTVKWSSYIYDYNDANAFFKELYREKTKQFESCIPNASKFPKSMFKLCNNLQTQSFTKDIFNGLEVIGQLDKKFIITVVQSQKLVVLFDQHAVHERVRLEKLLNGYKQGESEDSTIKFRSTELDEKIVLKFMSEELNVLTNFRNFFEDLGLEYTSSEDGIEINHVPTCIYNKFLGSKEKNKETYFENLINSLVYEQITMIMSTRGVTSKMPNVLQNIINLEACRGAVKFGDKLTINECEELVKDLSGCKLPFQCAHGRPTLVPVVSAKQNFEIKKIKLNLKKLKNT